MSIVPISAAVPSGKSSYSTSGLVSQAQIPQEILRLQAQIQNERSSKDSYATQQAIIQSLQTQVQQLQQQSDASEVKQDPSKSSAVSSEQPTITPWSATPTTRFISVKV
jgi:hypothetical protein